MIKPNHLGKFLLVGFILIAFQSFAQQKVFTGNPDTAFEKARKMAFNNQRKQAQDSLKLILTKYPNYLDIRSFLASTYSWDGNYKKSRTEFAYVLKKDPKRKTDWIAAINNELYAELPYRAYELVQKALIYFPKDIDLLYLKAKAEEKYNNPEQALSTLDEILAIEKSNKRAISYKESLINSLRFNSVGISYSVDLYNKNERDPMHYSTVKYTRKTKYGSITGKVNYSRRFDTNSLQYEFDLYPRISDGFYAYVSAGFSNDNLFPSFRYGFELFKSLPKSFEVSLGLRGLKYSETTTIYTGSLGWYTGSSYWSFRTYITPGDNGISKSGTLTYRKYRSDADNYFSLAIGFGFSPELDRFVVDNNATVIFNLKSQKINVGYTFTSANKISAWGTSFNLLREEKIFSRGDYYLVYSLGISYSLRFR